MKWITFVRALWPVVSALLKELFERHGGNAAAATQELQRIRDHWSRVRAEQTEVDERLSRLKQREHS